MTYKHITEAVAAVGISATEQHVFEVKGSVTSWEISVIHPQVCYNMSRRAAVVEEFDDDTDLPLPSMPLRNTDGRGPILQEMRDEDDEDDDLESSYRAGPASPPKQQPFSGSQQQWSQPDADKRVADITPYKTYVYSSSWKD